VLAEYGSGTLGLRESDGFFAPDPSITRTCSSPVAGESEWLEPMDRP